MSCYETWWASRPNSCRFFGRRPISRPKIKNFTVTKCFYFSILHTHTNFQASRFNNKKKYLKVVDPLKMYLMLNLAKIILLVLAIWHFWLKLSLLGCIQDIFDQNSAPWIGNRTFFGWTGAPWVGKLVASTAFWTRENGY